MKRRSKIVNASALACLLCALTTQGADPVKPFQPFQSGTPAGLTNLNSAAARKDGLKSFEEDITRSLQTFSPKGALDGVLAPQYRPPPPRLVIPNRRTKDELDPRSKWNFEREEKEDLLPDAFKPKPGDGLRDKPGRNSTLKDFYNDLDRRGPKESTTARPGRADDLDLDSDSRIPRGVLESAKSLREKLLGTDKREDSLKPEIDRSSLSDLFRPEKNSISRDQVQAHKDYVERFKQILDSSPNLTSAQTPLNSFNSSPGSRPAGYNNGYGGLESFGPTAKRDALASSPGRVGSVASPTIFPDYNAQVLNQWNPLYTPPRAELPKPAAPLSSSSAWDAPRRRF